MTTSARLLVVLACVSAPAHALETCAVSFAEAAKSLPGVWEMCPDATLVHVGETSQSTPVPPCEGVVMLPAAEDGLAMQIRKTLLDLAPLAPGALRNHDDTRVRTGYEMAVTSYGDPSILTRCSADDEPQWRAQLDVTGSDGTEIRMTTYMLLAEPDVILGVQQGFITKPGVDQVTEINTPFRMVQIRAYDK